MHLLKQTPVTLYDNVSFHSLKYLEMKPLVEEGKKSEAMSHYRKPYYYHCKCEVLLVQLKKRPYIKLTFNIQLFFILPQP